MTKTITKFKKTPEEVAELKIVDPACGSGSFLLGAYNYLLDWHLEYYTKDEKTTKDAQKKNKIYQSGESYKLTIEEKRKILINNIYGVDIDPQAVEVTKLSLLLKLLEDENQDANLFKTSSEAILPNLEKNIKCGNSLIGSDFYDNQDLALFDDEKMQKINVFDWEKEFPQVFSGPPLISGEGRGEVSSGNQNGFDIVIGNPPYVTVKDMDSVSRDYFFSNKKPYESATYKTDLYAIFMEKSLKIMNESAMFGMITPYSWLSSSSFESLRRLILNRKKIKEISVFPLGIFADANIKTAITILDSFKSKTFDIKDYREKTIDEVSKIIHVEEVSRKTPFSYIKNQEKVEIPLDVSVDDIVILRKINSSLKLQDLFDVDLGVNTANDEKYVFTTLENLKNPKRLIEGKDFDRYVLNWSGMYVDYLPNEMKKDKETARPGTEERFERNKIILYRFLSKNGYLKSVLDDEGFYTLGSTYVLSKKQNCEIGLSTLLAVLNSKLIGYFFVKSFSGSKITKNELYKLPIPKATPEQQEPLVKLVDQMLETQKKLHTDVSDSDKKLHTQRAEILDKQIDNLVFDLYGLSEGERQVVLNS